MKKTLFTLLILSTMLMSCETKYTYVFRHLQTHEVMLYTTSSKDTAQIIDNCKNYISVVPFNTEKNGVVDVKTQKTTWTDADGNRSVTPYVGEDPVIWFEPVGKITHEKSYNTLAIAATIIAIIAIFIIWFLFKTLSKIGAR